MAKKPIVSRKITITNAKIVCMNLIKKEVEEIEVQLPGKFKTHEKLIEEVQPSLPPDIKAVSVIDAKETKKLYGMYESVFLKRAFELDEKRNPVMEKPQALETENK